MEPDPEETRYELAITAMDAEDPDPEGFQPLTISTNRGAIALRHYFAPASRGGVVWMGGIGGGWDTPALGLYPRLARELLDHGVSSCRLRFRQPASLPECVLDALVAVRFLVETGCEHVGVVGHSAGGAVAMQAAVHATEVSTVVTLATQSYGATVADELRHNVSALLVHGAQDEILPPTCSRQVHALVAGRKRLLVLEGARHGLDEAAEETATAVRTWLLDELGQRPS